jgi:hypothetical protein
MWKSAVSISKVGGKGGKNSFIVFPSPELDLIFNAFRACVIIVFSCSQFGLTSYDFVLRLTTYYRIEREAQQLPRR